MKRIILGTVLALATGIASAGTMNNSDSTSYKLAVKQSGSTTHTSISGNSTVSSTCSSFPCTITNKDTGAEITLDSSSQNVVIKNGKFSIR